MTSTSPWESASERKNYPSLRSALEVDVAIVGGGIAGVTAAYELVKAGRRVALLEQGQIGDGMSGWTTAFVTYVTDADLGELRRTFGDAGASLAWASGRDAADEIGRIIREESIACDFMRCPAYFYAPDGAGQARLGREERLARKFGFQARLTEESLGFTNLGCLRVEEQGKFDPMKYLHALADRAVKHGAQIFEHSKVLGYSSGDPRVLNTAQGEVRARDVLLATYSPIGDPGRLSLRLNPWQTYVLEAEIPRGLLPEALLQDTLRPYHYFRVDRFPTHDRLILGGEDHPTGERTDTAARFARLEKFLHDLLPGQAIKVVRTWSGEILETLDGLPYVGRVGRGLYVATGFSGTGMTFGTLSAMLVRDLILKKPNPAAHLYRPGRLTALPRLFARGWRYLGKFLRDRLRSGGALERLQPGEGAIVELQGKKVAAYRTPEGALIKLSPVCTHLGCLVRWNGAAKTWDCPCHGSRFKKDGDVLNGPAAKPLEKLS